MPNSCWGEVTETLLMNDCAVGAQGWETAETSEPGRKGLEEIAVHVPDSKPYAACFMGAAVGTLSKSAPPVQVFPSVREGPVTSCFPNA